MLAARSKFVSIVSKRPQEPLSLLGRNDEAWSVPDLAYAKEDGTFGNTVSIDSVWDWPALAPLHPKFPFCGFLRSRNDQFRVHTRK